MQPAVTREPELDPGVHITVQYSTVLYSTIQYSIEQYLVSSSSCRAMKDSTVTPRAADLCRRNLAGILTNGS